MDTLGRGLWNEYSGVLSHLNYGISFTVNFRFLVGNALGTPVVDI